MQWRAEPLSSSHSSLQVATLDLMACPIAVTLHLHFAVRVMIWPCVQIAKQYSKTKNLSNQSISLFNVTHFQLTLVTAAAVWDPTSARVPYCSALCNIPITLMVTGEEICNICCVWSFKQIRPPWFRTVERMNMIFGTFKEVHTFICYTHKCIFGVVHPGVKRWTMIKWYS